MSYYAKSLVLVAASCAVLMLPSVAGALDIGGSNGVSVSGRNGGLSVSVGGASGVNASVGSGSSGGLGVNASVGGASGVSSSTSVGGRSSGGLGVGTTASVGGSSGVNANVNATVGGSRLASASADVGLGGSTLLNLGLGIPSTDDSGNPGTPGGSGNGGSGLGNNSRFVSMYNDMSSAEKARMKIRCKDVLRSGGFEAGLVKLCKMVVAMR